MRGTMISFDNLAKKSYRLRKKERRRTVLKLHYLWWLFSILFVALCLIVASYFTYRCLPWISGALVSLSCGCFTGATFYFLVNIRTNKERILKKEYNALKRTLELVNSICKYRDFYDYNRKTQRDGQNLDGGAEFLSLLDELEQSRNMISLSVYDTVPDLGYDPLDRDNMNAYRDKIRSAKSEREICEYMSEICYEIYKAESALQKLLRVREDQLSFITDKSL